MKKNLLALIFVTAVSTAQAGWLDKLGLTPSTTNATASPTVTSAAVSALSDTQVVGGLKDALGNGLQKAIASLGHDGGFLTNASVKIPLPEKLQMVEKALRAVKQEKLADEFVGTMNHAAELAVPAAATVFGDAMKQMSIADAKSVLTGPKDSATQFFRRTTQTNLYEKFYPLVQSATAKAGVTSSYKKMMSAAGGSSMLSGKIGGLAKNYLGDDALDVDAYVTHKTLDGLFKMVADEEQSIRENPVSRTTDLMKQVFGAVSK
ncbi:MAG: hypothetical protein RL616_969 [Verrucomicrobiota bacterium]